jgi:hypothetical protein
VNINLHPILFILPCQLTTLTNMLPVPTAFVAVAGDGNPRLRTIDFAKNVSAKLSARRLPFREPTSAPSNLIVVELTSIVSIAKSLISIRIVRLADDRISIHGFR